MKKNILVYGYGNPGRQDDGLGPAFVEMLNIDCIPGVYTDCNYQLNIEDIVSVLESDAVIFVDAKVNGKEVFTFKEVKPVEEIAFTTHSISPGLIVALTNNLFQKNIKAYILAIRGYSWKFMEEMTPGAKKNLEKAYQFLKEKMVDIIY